MASRRTLLVCLALAVALLAFIAASPVDVSADRPFSPPVVSPQDNLMVRINRLFAASVSNAYSIAFIRFNTLSMVAIYDAINLIHRVYTPLYQYDRLKAHEKQADYRAAMLGALNETRFYGLNHIPDGYNASILIAPSAVKQQFDELSAFVTTELAALRAAGVSQCDIDAGFAIGTRVGARVNVEREDDGYRTYVAPLDPECGVVGQWCSYFERAAGKPVGRRGYYYSNLAYWRAFSFESPRELMCPPPLTIDTPLWRSGVNTTFLQGVKGSPYTSAEMANEAAIWAQGTAIQIVSYFMDGYFTQTGLRQTEYDSVAMFTAMHLANFDAGVHLTYNKIEYKLWRPHQIYAYLNPTANYSSFVGNVPVHINPEYPCAQCEGTSANARALERFLGYDAFPSGPVTLKFPGAKIQPVFTSFSQLTESVSYGRITGGVHLPFSTLVGVRYGQVIADKVSPQFFQPEDRRSRN